VFEPRENRGERGEGVEMRSGFGTAHREGLGKRVAPGKREHPRVEARQGKEGHGMEEAFPQLPSYRVVLLERPTTVLRAKRHVCGVGGQLINGLLICTT